MTSTYEKIATYTAPSNQANYTFTTIAGTYTDLVLVSNAKGTASETTCMQFNGDTGNNYSFTYLVNAVSGRASNLSFAIGGGVGSADFSTSLTYINNYSNSTTYKTVLNRRGPAASYVAADVSLWRNTAAITSIKIFPENGASFVTGSTFTLYGIKAE
jgi:hypothetical protein